MSDWWLSRASGTPEGPFPTQLLVQGLSAGQIPVQAYVCRVGEQRWARISQVDEIWSAAHPDQEKTQVNEQPWFENAIEKLAHDVRETNRLADEDDENERTQITTPMPVVAPGASTRRAVTPVPLAQPAKRSAPTPLPTPQSPPKPTFTPLPHLPTAVPGAHSAQHLPSPVLPTPPRQISVPNHLPQTPRVAAEAAQEPPIRAKIPTLEGISASGPAPTAANSEPIQRDSPAGSATTSPQPVPTRARLLGSETKNPIPQPPAPLGLKGLGLNPLPKAPTAFGLVPGISALPTLPTPPQVAPVVQTAARPIGQSAVATGPAPTVVSAVGDVTPAREPKPAFMPLDDTDNDEVTRIAKSAFLPDESPVDSAFEEDVTTIVSADKLPDASPRLSQPNAIPTPHLARNARVVAPEPIAVVAPQPIASSPQNSTPSVDSNHNTESAPALVADPADLLEEDADDTSLPLRSISRGPYPSTAPLRREKTPTPPAVQPTNVSTGPVISVPPKAVHQSNSPSIVLKPEPIVHQEATKPAVRALRQPGVIQITYGTLVIAVLGVVLLVLVLVLVLK